MVLVLVLLVRQILTALFNQSSSMARSSALPPPKMIHRSRITYPINPPPSLPSKMNHDFPDHPCRHVIHQFVIKKNDPTGSNSNT